MRPSVRFSGTVEKHFLEIKRLRMGGRSEITIFPMGNNMVIEYPCCTPLFFIPGNECVDIKGKSIGRPCGIFFHDIVSDGRKQERNLFRGGRGGCLRSGNLDLILLDVEFLGGGDVHLHPEPVLEHLDETAMLAVSDAKAESALILLGRKGPSVEPTSKY